MKQTLQSCYNRLGSCRISDRQKFRQRLKRVQKEDRNGHAKISLDSISKKIDASIKAVEQRLAQRPAIEYPASLPVTRKKNEIAEAIKKNQVIIVCGETGSGKTTQIPKICLELGLGSKGLIGHTQPRRLAARAVASRIAEEMNTTVGEAVGYKVRFSDHSHPDSYIKLMTDGILLAECHHDPYLNQYDTLIIDEAHERSLNIDFLLGYLKRLINRRKDLKLIITSATIDPDLFARHFNDAPVISVSGRTYPVKILYRPLDQVTDEASQLSRDLQQGILDAVNELSQYDRGDILVFLSGERDIREIADTLKNAAKNRNKALANTEILPLLARQSATEQNRIFHPGSKRRIILATNVAETSLTVPGIKYVIDSGLARISRYSWRSKIQRLPIEKISQASANQRKGRCGRVSEGICIRLYDEDDFEGRDTFTVPEIKRTNLAAVILQMEFLQLGHIDDFPFVEPPEQKMISDGYKLLFELGAINKKNRLTGTGRKLARLPVDPRLGRMLIEAEKEASLNEVLVIISALATQDVRERPQDRQQAADEKHREFIDTQSDFIFYLNLWEQFHQQKNSLSGNQLRRWCKTYFISWMRMREWIDTHRQVQKLLRECQFRFNSQSADYASIHRAILTGLPGNIGVREEGREYTGARNRKFHIFPGSALFKKSSRWIMSAEIVETSRVYARINANIEPQWIEEKASHLIRHSYRDPYWQERQGQVSAFEQASLYGLILYSDRKVNFSRIDPARSREIFIYNALVKMKMHSHADFIKHNRKLVEEIRALEAKSRKPDILVDDEQLYSGFDTIIPADVCNTPLFNSWYKQCRPEVKKQLFLDRNMLMKHDASNIDAYLFPDFLDVKGTQFPLSYHFDTRHERDGITMTIPLACLDLVHPQRCEWLVPGLLEKKMTELIRSLPKNIRRSFVPAPDFAHACFEALSADDFPLAAAMSNHLKKMSGINIPFDAWNPDKLDPHLFMYFKVINADNEILAEGRDLVKIKQQLEGYQDTSVQPDITSANLEQTNVDAKILDTLPDKIEQGINGVKVTAYPTLVRKGKNVSVCIRVNRQQAQAEFTEGLQQLFINAIPSQIKDLKRTMPDIQAMCLKYASLGTCDELKNDIIEAVINQVFLSHEIHSYSDFQRVLNTGKSRLYSNRDKWCELVSSILDILREINKSLKKPPLDILDTVNDIQGQLSYLFPAHFITAINANNLQHYPRYLEAIRRRIEKAHQNPQRDRQLRLGLGPLWQQYVDRYEVHNSQQIYSPQLESYRWLVEEYRVSLFAQTLKTQLPVSEKRLKKAWNEITDS